MSATSDPRLKSLKSHPIYFHTGGDVTIIIGDVAFRVASIFFTRESPIFRERLERKSNDNAKDQKGPVDTIVIEPRENVSADDFAKLCWVFYNEKYSIYEAPLATWETILRLANQYQFPEVKDLAFRQISIPEKFELSVVNRIVLYRKHKAEFQYLEPLYAELFSRAEPLTLNEGNALGMTLTLLISGARERLRAASDKLGSLTRLPDSMKDTVGKMVQAVFANGPLLDLAHHSTGPTMNGPWAPPGPNPSGTSTPATQTTSDRAPPGGGRKTKGKKNGLLGDWDEE